MTSTTAPPAAPKAAARRLRPKDAATLIVVDRDGPEPRVLMGRRHPGLAFMPGKFVFPGGRVEPGDRFMVATGALAPGIETALASAVSRPSPHRGRTLALAAIRETYEETGLLIGRAGEPAPGRRVPAAWESYAGHGILPDLSALHFLGRAITPPGRPRRFDARFFAVERPAVCGSVEGRVGPDQELVELAWLTLSDARALDLPRITGVMLAELESSLAAGMPDVAPRPLHVMRRGRYVTDSLA